MLKRLQLKNFTAFSTADIAFSKEVNVIIGTNGMGKSHLLKLGYSLCAAMHEEGLPERLKPFKGEEWLGEKLVKVYNIETLGRLVRRRQGRAICEVKADFFQKANASFSFSTNAKYLVKDYSSVVTTKVKPSICIPPKEVLSIYPGLAQAIEDRELSFDHIYYDLCKQLGRKPLRGKRFTTISELLSPIENEVLGGGTFYEENGRFYFSKAMQGNLEAPLVAEGLCKVGVLAHLLRNGSLVKQGTLFWDEPESNLNPQLLRLVAKTMVNLANHGVQVVVATHSLFLMRELDILSRKDEAEVQFIGLSGTDDGVEVSQGKNIEDIKIIQALEADLEQSERYLALEYGDE